MGALELVVYYPSEVFFSWLAMWFIGGLLLLVGICCKLAIRTHTIWGPDKMYMVVFCTVVVSLLWPVALYQVAKGRLK